MSELPARARELLEAARSAEEPQAVALEHALDALHARLEFGDIPLSMSAGSASSTTTGGLFAGKVVKLVLASVVLGGAWAGWSTLSAPTRHAASPAAQERALGKVAPAASESGSAAWAERVEPGTSAATPARSEPSAEAESPAGAVASAQEASALATSGSARLESRASRSGRAAGSTRATAAASTPSELGLAAREAESRAATTGAVAAREAESRAVTTGAVAVREAESHAVATGAVAVREAESRADTVGTAASEAARVDTEGVRSSSDVVRAAPQTALAASSELDLIDAALASLRAHDGEGALALLERHAREHANGKFSTERRGLRVLALCATGRLEEGRREQAAFLRARSAAPIAVRVRRACASEEP